MDNKVAFGQVVYALKLLHSISDVGLSNHDCLSYISRLPVVIDIKLNQLIQDQAIAKAYEEVSVSSGCGEANLCHFILVFVAKFVDYFLHFVSETDFYLASFVPHAKVTSVVVVAVHVRHYSTTPDRGWLSFLALLVQVVSAELVVVYQDDFLGTNEGETV